MSPSGDIYNLSATVNLDIAHFFLPYHVKTYMYYYLFETKVGF